LISSERINVEQAMENRRKKNSALGNEGEEENQEERAVPIPNQFEFACKC
jgi:hypothetical protein